MLEQKPGLARFFYGQSPDAGRGSRKEAYRANTTSLTAARSGVPATARYLHVFNENRECPLLAESRHSRTHFQPQFGHLAFSGHLSVRYRPKADILSGRLPTARTHNAAVDFPACNVSG